MAKTALYKINGRQLTVQRVGNEYAVILETGEVYGHRTTPDVEEATRIMLAVANGRTPEWRPVGRVA